MKEKGITKVIFLNKYTNGNIKVAKERLKNFNIGQLFISELIEFNTIIK